MNHLFRVELPQSQDLFLLFLVLMMMMRTFCPDTDLTEEDERSVSLVLSNLKCKSINAF